MNATCDLVLRTSYTKKDGTHPVNLRLTINRTSKYFNLGISCRKDDWNIKKQRIKRDHVQYLGLREKLVYFAVKYRQSK